MSLQRLNILYQEVVLDHSKHPHGYGPIDKPTHQMELLNPTCGDMIQVELRVDHGIIEAVGFQGHGCSISMASASMMTESLRGQSLDQARRIIEGFNHLVGGLEPSELDEEVLRKALKDAYLLKGVRNFPARYKCAILAWKAVEMGLDSDNSRKVEEI